LIFISLENPAIFDFLLWCNFFCY